MTRVMLTVGVLAALVLPARAQEVTEYYGTDALGSVRVVFDATGTVVGRTDYVPFGDALNPSGALPPEQFTGQVRDGDAGLDYFGARYYAARFGRFSTVDPISGTPSDPQSWNRYAYARNAPGTFVDPTGMQGCVPSPGVNFCTGVTETLPREASSGAIGLPLGGVFLWAGWDDWFETEKKQNGWDDHLNYVWDGNRAVRAWYPDESTESSGGDGVLDAIGDFFVSLIDGIAPTLAGSSPPPIFLRPGQHTLLDGPPNSTQTYHNEGPSSKMRFFNEHGRATHDIDVGHEHGKGDPHGRIYDPTKGPISVTFSELIRWLTNGMPTPVIIVNPCLLSPRVCGATLPGIPGGNTGG